MKAPGDAKKVSKKKVKKSKKKASFHRGSRRAGNGDDGDVGQSVPPRDELPRSEALKFHRLKS